MNKLVYTSVAILALCTACNRAPSAGTPKSDEQKQAYAIGYQYGQSLGNQTPGLDIETLAGAIVEGYKKQNSKMTPPEMEASLQKLFVAKRDELVQANAQRAQASAAFMQDSLTKGFKATKAGVAYREVATGKGAKPAASSKVTLRYKALLPDGSEVDSTLGKPDNSETFKFADLIPGLKEAVGLMPAGSRWNVLVPPELAYGPSGTAKVPPNALVIYDVELVKVQ